MGTHTIGGNFNITEAELKQRNGMITRVSGTDDNLIIEGIDEATLNVLIPFINSKRKDEKAEFIAATTTEKINIIAKKLGLM